MKEIDITNYTIESSKIKPGTGYKFVLLSDLHSNTYGINLHDVNKMIIKEKPDAVLIAGDMFTGSLRDNPQDVINYLSVLAGHYPVFFALGNHEYRMKTDEYRYGSKYEEIRNYLEEKNVVFLEDETVYLDKDDNRIALSGIMIDSCFYKRIPPVMGSGLVEKHLGVADKSYFNLLLAHNPDYIDNYADWGADLVLSGHLHGGTVRIPGMGGIFSTTIRPMPYFDEGLYEDGTSYMVVSRGMGTHHVNLRINNHPEVVVVKVIAKKEQ